jgi:hypothetical protein
MRMLFAFGAELNLRVEHLDVKTAFLNGKLKETVHEITGNGVECQNAKKKVALLHKAGIMYLE